ncbi:MFS transporter [Actinoplanes sp. SE50]|uniref:MFS transporter n=1 Tax=unclassified Actinoplanes TaxID=2626549 RepID=UPI00023EC65D|nr:MULTISPECIES: MFS transporter [unclassified Actinoplanes]AEV85317.1 Enterobactin exporter entS [Actinoplanes sp. SE50/110]ATO83712.1 MFS transporter [Actinoplanes sp. SE50]SLM01120.1 MFS transporter [Actinoplanes sp. SE50/110]
MGLSAALIDLRPLRSSPAFRRLWAGGLLSGLGTQMTLVAVMYQVWRQTHSTVWTGAVALAQALPIVVFGLFAGALADRADRRRLSLGTTAGLTLCSALLTVQGFLGLLPVTGLLALVVVQACFVAAGGPAQRTFLPHLLTAEELPAGLALKHISFQAAMLAGPALGGLMLGWLGVGGCYLVDTLTFLAALYGIAGLPSLPGGAEPGRSGLRAVGEGLRFMAHNRAVRGALLTDLAATVLAMPISLFPLINAERFGGGERTFGLFLTSVAVGGVIASLLSGTYTRLGRPGLTMLGGAILWGLALAAFGLVTDPWLSLGCLALAGLADTVSVVSRATVIQQHTPAALLGRAAAAEQIVGQAGPDVGNMRAGLVAGAFSGPVALVSGGLLCVLAVGVIARTSSPRA